MGAGLGEDVQEESIDLVDCGDLVARGLVCAVSNFLFLPSFCERLLAWELVPYFWFTRSGNKEATDATDTLGASSLPFSYMSGPILASLPFLFSFCFRASSSSLLVCKDLKLLFFRFSMGMTTGPGFTALDGGFRR
jgi:hypothetical protein